MRIFLPGRSACSRTRTRRPRRPAAMAHRRPAAPAPRMRTSVSVMCCLEDNWRTTGLMNGTERESDEDRREQVSGEGGGEGEAEGPADEDEGAVRVRG